MQRLDALILASASPRRYEILTSLGLRVTVIESGFPEPSLPDVTPKQLAEHHAAAKGRLVAAGREHELVVAADTVVDVDGVAFGKPQDLETAAAMLTQLSGREHLVHTAVALSFQGKMHAFTATTRVWFVPLTKQIIQAYLATGESLDKAGAYGIQGRGALLVDRIDGDFLTVMGFPLGEFMRVLPSCGLNVL